MQHKILLAALSSSLLLYGCSDRQNQPSAEAQPAQPATTVVANKPSTATHAEESPVRLLSSTSAHFVVDLPCSDCAGINLSLDLQRNEIGENSFVLRYHRLAEGSRPVIRAGNWRMQSNMHNDMPVAIVVLNPDNPARSAQLRINNDSSLTLVDGALNGVAAAANVRLTMQGGNLDLQTLYQHSMNNARN